MNHSRDRATTHFWRLAIIGAGHVYPCSCQAPASHGPGWNSTAPGEATAQSVPGEATAQSGPAESTSQVVQAAWTSPPVPGEPTSPLVPGPNGYAAMPPQAYAGMPPSGPCFASPPGMEAGVPLPYAAVGPSAPPGIVPALALTSIYATAATPVPRSASVPTAIYWACKWKTRSPATVRSTAATWSSPATRSASTARGFRRCGRS